MKLLAAGIFLATDVCPLTGWKGRIQQDIFVQIVNEQIGVPMEPLAIFDSEPGKRGLAFTVD